MLTCTILLALGSVVSALPAADLHRRQDASSAAQVGTSIPPVPLPSPITVETSIPPVSLPSPISSSTRQAASATQSGATAAIASMTPITELPGYYPGYPCPDGYLLSYAEDQRTFPYGPEVFQELGIWGDWLKAPQYGDVQINPSEEGINGSSRLRSVPGFSAITETLINSTNSDTFYQADSNLTAPIVRDDHSIATWSHVFQTFVNETDEAVESTGRPSTTVKFFANACGQNQTITIDQLQFLFGYTFGTIAQVLEEQPVESATLGSAAASPTIQTNSIQTMVASALGA